MSENTKFKQYNSPNIVIVPSMLGDNPPQKSDAAENKTSNSKDDASNDTSKSIPILIQRTTTNSESCNADKKVKCTRWSSNYEPNIGLSYEKSRLKQREIMNNNTNNMFFTQDSVPSMSAQLNRNYINFNDQSQQNNFVTHKNVPQSTEVGVNMPVTSYHSAYVNENNNYSYYYGQPINNYKAYYDPSNIHTTIVNANLPTEYMNTLSHPSNDIGHPMVTYYDPKTSSTLVSNHNIPTKCPDTNNKNTPTADDFTESTTKNTRAPTPLVDENPATSCCGNINKCSKFLVTSSRSNDISSGQTELKTAANSFDKKKCCDCMCSKGNLEGEIKYRQELEQKSSVQAHEKAFRDFLNKLKMERPSETKKKQIICKETSSKDTSTKLKTSKKSKSKKDKYKKQKCSVQENEKAFRIFLEKLKIEKELTLRRLKQLHESSKKTSSKDTTSSNVKATAYSEKDKIYRDSKEQKEKRPKFIKTKYVDEQEPLYKPEMKNSSCEDFTSTSYNLSNIGYLKNNMIKKYKLPVDKNQPKFIKTKYVDKQEPEYKPIKKARIDVNYDNTKCSTINSDSTYFKLKRSRDESKSSDRISRKDDNSSKFSNCNTDSVKYYKCSKDRIETRKKTPVKSIVKISEKREIINKSPRCSILENEDLRDTLIRKLHKIPRNKDRKHDIPKRKSPEDSNDSLVVTVNNKLSENKDVPDNSKDKQKSKITKNASCKNINLVINITYKEPGGTRSRSESDKSESDDHSPQTNVDLSFLDDFNVDEIVASLNKYEKNGTCQISKSDEPYVTNSEEDRSKLDSSNALTQRDTLKITEAKMILQKGDELNNLISKEASLLDSVRTKHEEIRSEKRSCVVKEADKVFGNYTDSELSQKESNDSLLGVNQQVKDLTLPKKNCVTQEPNTSDSSLNALKEHIQLFSKKDTQTKDPLNESVPKDEHYFFIKPYEKSKTSANDDIIFQVKIDETERSELLRILEDAKDDALGLVETQKNIASDSLLPTTHLPEKDLKALSIIDLSNDDSTDSNEIKLSKQKTLCLDDDVYIVEEPKKDHETIDLTTDENSNSQNAKKSFKASNAVTNKDCKNEKQDKAVIYKTATKQMIIKDPIADNKLSVQDVTKQKSRNNISRKIVNAIKDSIVSLQKNESLNIAVDSLEKDAVKPFSTQEINSTKEAASENIDSGNVQEIPNIQVVTLNTQSDIYSVENEKHKLKDIKNIELETKKKDTIKYNILSGTETNVRVNKSAKAQPVPQAQAEVTPDKISKDIKDKHCGTKTLTKDVSITQTSGQNASETKCKIISNSDENEKDGNDKIVESQMKEFKTEVGNVKLVESSKNNKHLVSLSEVNVDEKMKPEDISKELSKAQKDIEKTEASTTKSVPSTSDTQAKVYIDQNTLKTEDDKSKAQTNNQNTEASTTKSMPSTLGMTAKVNVDENNLKSEDDKSKAQTDIKKTEAMPSTSDSKVNSSSPKVKKEKSNANADVKTEDGNIKMTVLPHHDGVVPKLALRLEREMFKIFGQKYTILGLIRAGTYSKVFHCHSKGQDYAVKSLNVRCLSTNQTFYKHAEKNEMLYDMQRGATRNIHGCAYVVNSFSMMGHFVFIMDYYPKNLRQALKDNGKPFHINVVQHLARQLVSAVMMLTRHNVVHLDINPCHILLNLTNDKLKLCGFDEACYVNKIPPMTAKLGSVNYRSPEAIMGYYQVGFEVDIWATGLVLYEMATNIKLFPGFHNNDILFKQMRTLGALPIEMINRSRFAYEHFIGTSFKRLLGKNLKDINFITKFYKSKRLEETIMQAYNVNWRNNASQMELKSDIVKVLCFTSLLKEMLEVDPSKRIPIFFMNESDFITK